MKQSASLEIQFALRHGQSPADKNSVRPSGGRLPRVTQVLALAIHFDNMIQQGEATDYAEIARLSCLCRERVSQIMRLNYLAPDIQIELLNLPALPRGRYPISESAARRIANLLSWVDQRREWARLKQHHQLT